MATPQKGYGKMTTYDHPDLVALDQKKQQKSSLSVSKPATTLGFR
jgi:hypothetical protein